MDQPEENKLFDEINLYREDETTRSRSDFTRDEGIARDRLQKDLAARLSRYMESATTEEIQVAFSALMKPQNDYFTQLVRDVLHERCGIPKNAPILTWVTRTPSNATGLDEE